MSSEFRVRQAGTPVATAKRMEAIGAALGEALLAHDDGENTVETLGRAAVIYLQGPLGAGKTTFARGVLRTFGVSGAVKSPTYTLVEPYATDHGPVAHFDFYRLAHVDEVEFLGMREYLDRGVCLFEWPERAHGGLPHPDLVFEITPQEGGRDITATALSTAGERWLNELISRELLQETVPNT
jgi:tRNA threonylcarbamoyladenosine biosynthesis protein TsaE